MIMVTACLIPRGARGQRSSRRADLVAVAVGSSIPLMVQAALALRSIRAAAERTDRTLQAAGSAVERINRLAAQLEEKGRIESFMTALDALAQTLNQALRRDLLAKPMPRPHEIHTRVEFDNVVSDRYTVIDLRAQDRLGLLYVIASTLSELDDDVTLAKIATETDQAMDVFYVTEKDGRKVMKPERMDTIRKALAHAIAEGIA